MSVIVAPWLRGTDVLGSMQAGGHLGLSARQADQRDAEMQMQAELAAQREQQNAQEAAARLRENYDALAQARELALRKGEYDEKHEAAKLLQDKTEADALAVYRAGTLKNQEARLNQEKGFQSKGHFAPNGDYFKEVEPGVVKQLFTAPVKPVIDKIPTVSGVPLDPLDPTLGKISALANNPILNRLMGTNANTLGTNYVAPMPRLAPRAQAPAPVIDVEDLTREEPAQPEDAKVLDKQTAAAFLKQAGGDKQKARQLAKEAGYSF